ncbi:MAG: hypothetical protein K9H58_12910 [Bacteroidales bacterium]|nr:hypothetical protein [Bacteroidales bacterium]
MVEVNHINCHQAAEILKGINIRPDFYKRKFLNLEADRETKLRIYLFSAAICHQTHTLHHSALNLWGWDYLEKGFIQMLEEKSQLLSPEWIISTEVPAVRNHLASFYSPDGTPAKSSLDRLDERTSMLVELSKHMVEYHASHVSDFIDQSCGLLLHRENGLYQRLGKFKAFCDPQKKKITFFLKLAMDARVIKLKDPQNLIPIMDYHMQRVLLRLGCIDFTDKNYFNQLRKQESLKSDEPVRSASIEAIKLIGEASGHGILKMNDFFWPLGRSCCNKTTLCHDQSCAKSPCTFEQMTEIHSHKNCVFEQICEGSRNDEYRELWEPIVNTHYY